MPKKNQSQPPGDLLPHAFHLSMVPRHEVVSSLTVFTCSHIHMYGEKETERERER